MKRFLAAFALLASIAGLSLPVSAEGFIQLHTEFTKQQNLTRFDPYVNAP